MKKFINDIEAIPSKRLYLSIIVDYHLELALCELIDNAIDNWIFNQRPRDLIIKIDLDYERQTIQVVDNSGGIKEDDIQLIVSPGQSRENYNDEIIGVFGVGSKRAVIALAEDVKIFTRHSNEKTILVEIDDAWISDEENWFLKAYEVDPIEENSTMIELIKLRDPILPENESNLIEHLGATYALFLDTVGLDIILNEKEIKPKTFDNWSYPPGFEPKHFKGPIDFGDRGRIDVEIQGGLTKSHREESSSEEYGVYFYCNDRLIARGYKGSEVGYKPPRVGKPHPSLSLARVLVKLHGTVELMPWNSSKSEIDFKHKTFREIMDHIERVLFTYASMSRNWSGEWEEKIFQYKTGIVKTEALNDVSRNVRIHLPAVPRSPKKRKYADILKRNNRAIAQSKPWIVGSYETEIAVEQIISLKLEQNFRISMLLLDSGLEIAFKDYLVNDSGKTFSEGRLAAIMKNRSEVHNEIKGCKVRINKEQWKKIEHFYRLRCDLVHKRSTVTISFNDLNTFRETYKYTVNKLFKVDFSKELRN
ncbi:molecular chaperone of HSP90 family [Belliella baltica DSM 15883]|uniref:Molecular chaperone of HSP90 family n=1 Tax=Belliella baltica (strain DSM 15883 / CIP 108006 / LMG 21964 / BA134) TaxID=866536 RepID=I3Z2Y1_BELBD|nr:ATP-binding protein [Belliella baltica]AFL83599.1 molecular chaperone of HSP90 family [Belliella baltica DSM 15883]